MDDIGFTWVDDRPITLTCSRRMWSSPNALASFILAGKTRTSSFNGLEPRQQRMVLPAGFNPNGEPRTFTGHRLLRTASISGAPCAVIRYAPDDY